MDFEDTPLQGPNDPIHTPLAKEETAPPLKNKGR